MTTTTVPDIDVARYSKLLLKIEAHAHRHGWDGPVHLRLIWDEDLVGPDVARGYRNIAPPEPRYRPVTHERYVSTTFFGHRVLYQQWSDLPPELVAELQETEPDARGEGPNPWIMLRRLVMNTAYGPDDDDKVRLMRAILRERGLLGFAVVGEAWRNEGEACERAVRGEVYLGDLPTSVETRVVYSVDLAGRIQRVERVRRQKPSLLTVDPAQMRNLSRPAMREIKRAMRLDGQPDPTEQLAEAEAIGVDLNDFDWSATIDTNALMRGDFTTSMRIMRDMVLERLPQTAEEFAVRYPTLRTVLEARCSDPREPDGCPHDPHDHSDPREWRVVDGRWYRGGDW